MTLPPLCLTDSSNEGTFGAQFSVSMALRFVQGNLFHQSRLSCESFTDQLDTTHLVVSNGFCLATLVYGRAAHTLVPR